MRRAFWAFLIVSTVSYAGLAADECASADLRLVLHDRNPKAVRTLEDRWAQAYANRDTAALNCIFAADFEISFMPDQGLEVHNKLHVLQWVVTRDGSAELERIQIKSHHTAVVARGAYSVRRDGKVVSRFQFTDFFVYRDNRWQAVARILAQLPPQ